MENCSGQTNYNSKVCIFDSMELAACTFGDQPPQLVDFYGLVLLHSGKQDPVPTFLRDLAAIKEK